MNYRSIYYFVLSIPIINIIATITTNYFASQVNPGVVRGVFVFVFLAYFILLKYPKNSISLFLLFSLLYYLTLIPFATVTRVSLYQYLKFFQGTIMFVVGYYYINTPSRFLQLIKVQYAVLVIIILNFFVSNYFGLGYSDYARNSISYGVSGVNITKTMVPILLSFPIFFSLNKLSRKGLYISLLIMFVSFILIILGLKRSAILALGAGFFAFTITYPQKKALIKGLVIVSFLFTIASPFFIDIFQDRFEARQESGVFETEDIEENEGRVIEMKKVLRAFEEGNIWHKLFGSELFNDRYYFKETRMLHVDYSILLNGSGLIGLSLFIGFFMLYYLTILRYKTLLYSKSNLLVNMLYSYSVSLIVVSLVLSIAGSVYSIGLRSTTMMLMGSTLATIRNIVITNYQDPQ